MSAPDRIWAGAWAHGGDVAGSREQAQALGIMDAVEYVRADRQQDRLERAQRVTSCPKPRPELLPALAVLAVASVMAAGEPEHGDRWRRHPAAHHVGAALRHLLRWCAGEPYDHDLHAQGHGKHSHLACAAARCLMALEAEITPPKGTSR